MEKRRKLKGDCKKKTKKKKKKEKEKLYLILSFLFCFSTGLFVLLSTYMQAKGFCFASCILEYIILIWRNLAANPSRKMESFIYTV